MSPQKLSGEQVPVLELLVGRVSSRLAGTESERRASGATPAEDLTGSGRVTATDERPSAADDGRRQPTACMLTCAFDAGRPSHIPTRSTRRASARVRSGSETAGQGFAGGVSRGVSHERPLTHLARGRQLRMPCPPGGAIADRREPPRCGWPSVDRRRRSQATPPGRGHHRWQREGNGCPRGTTQPESRSISTTSSTSGSDRGRGVSLSEHLCGAGHRAGPVGQALPQNPCRPAA